MYNWFDELFAFNLLLRIAGIANLWAMKTVQAYKLCTVQCMSGKE